MLGLCFVGTDTGVGKTVVTAAVARSLRRQGHAVRVCKPVATGAQWMEGRWLSEDTLHLAEAADALGSWEDITPWVFPDPVAPPVAARRQGKTLHFREIVEAVRQRGRSGSIFLMEGVGGLLCPITDQETVADLVAALRLPVVVVARRSLGTLNHTLLTVEVACRRDLTVAGVVVNETTPPQGLAEATNVKELQHWLPVPLLAVIPYQSPSPFIDLPAVEAIDWHRLCHSHPRAHFSDEEPLPACRP